VPPVTEFLVSTATGTAEATSNFRKDSTRVRSLIYERTLEQIPDRLLTGHGKAGPPIFNSFSLGRVGSHSFILGNLLYTLGLVGFGLFVAFWGALTWDFNRERALRPSVCFGVLLLFTLVSPVMTFGSELVNLLVVLMAALTLSPKTPSESQP
jgi:O-antigen ligase